MLPLFWSVRRNAVVDPIVLTGLVRRYEARFPSDLLDPDSAPVGAEGAVATWKDRSSFGIHATQALLTKRPIRKLTGLGGVAPSLRFDGFDDTLSIPYTFGSAATIFLVASPSTIVSSYAMSADAGTLAILSNFASRPFEWWNGSGAERQTLLAAGSGSGPAVLTVRQTDSSNLTGRANGNVSFNKVPTTTISGRNLQWLGTANGSTLNPAAIDIGALLIYSRALTDAECQQVERALGAAYGISVA